MWRVQEATMNRHLAHALGATALGALLLQPVTAMADPPAHARNENSAQQRGYSGHGQRGDDRWDDRRYREHGRDYREHDRRYDDRRGWDSHYSPPRRGYVVHHLPHRHRVVHHHGHRYYYGGGAWYRPYGSRYVVVDPPVGLVVSFLPQFSTTLHIGGVPYYSAGPVYYVWNPRARGYVVTDRPYRRW
jgi:hypothetical protein